MPTAEQRKEAFTRLASQRTNTVLHRMRVLGNCANPQLYNYTDADVRRIFAAIRKELKSVEARFTNGNKPSDFQL